LDFSAIEAGLKIIIIFAKAIGIQRAELTSARNDL